MGTGQPRSVALTGSRSRSSARRRTLHVCVGAASWVALAGLWVWQLDVYVPSNWLAGVGLILALLATWACFAVAWVAWNRSIYRRRHRRTTPVSREVDFDRDSLGRPIVVPADIRAVRGQLILSVSDSGVKSYHPAPQRATPQPADVPQPVEAPEPADVSQPVEAHEPADVSQPVEAHEPAEANDGGRRGRRAA